MSEADHTWRIDVGGVEHDVEIDHSTFTGKIVVTVDGKEVGDGRLWFATKEITFDVAGTPAMIDVKYAVGGFAVQSSLHVDGRYVEPLR
jgi:hypothetical protein